MTEAVTGIPDTARTPRTRRTWLSLPVVLSATFLGQFDFFVVNVAAPTIRVDLGASDATLQLIIGGYAFAYAAGLITAGRLGDAVGYRRMFLLGLTAFGVTSLLCGLSQTPAQLVGARLLQGLSASAMLPQVLAFITATIPSRRRSVAIAWYGVAGGVGSICGQVLGGAFVEVADGFGWRLIFLVNLPVVLVATGLAIVVLPYAERGRARFDLVGAFGITATLAAFLVPLTLGPGRNWPMWTGITVALAPVLGTATIAYERRLAAGGGAPVVPGSLLRVPTFVTGLLAVAAFMLFFPSYMFALTLLLQDGLRLAPLAAGLVFVPAGVTFSVGALVAGPLYRRFGVLAPLAGCVVTSVGLVALVGLTAAGGLGTPVGMVTACSAAISLGNGVVLPTLTTVTLTDVHSSVAGTASGLTATVQQFGSAAGVALIGTVFFAVAASRGGPIASVHAASVSMFVDVALVGVVAASLLVVRRARST